MFVVQMILPTGSRFVLGRYPRREEAEADVAVRWFDAPGQKYEIVEGRACFGCVDVVPPGHEMFPKKHPKTGEIVEFCRACAEAGVDDQMFDIADEACAEPEESERGDTRRRLAGSG